MTRFLVATLLLSVAAAQAAPSYTQEMFRRSLYQAQALMTTGPLYIIITLRDANRRTERTAAIPGPFLFGAIDLEYRLPLPDPEHPPKTPTK